MDDQGQPTSRTSKVRFGIEPDTGLRGTILCLHPLEPTEAVADWLERIRSDLGLRDLVVVMGRPRRWTLLVLDGARMSPLQIACARLSRRLQTRGLTHDFLPASHPRLAFDYEATMWRGFDVPVDTLAILHDVLSRAPDPDAFETLAIRSAARLHTRLAWTFARHAVLELSATVDVERLAMLLESSHVIEDEVLTLWCRLAGRDTTAVARSISRLERSAASSRSEVDRAFIAAVLAAAQPRNNDGDPHP